MSSALGFYVGCSVYMQFYFLTFLFSYFIYSNLIIITLKKYCNKNWINPSKKLQATLFAIQSAIYYSLSHCGRRPLIFQRQNPSEVPLSSQTLLQILIPVVRVEPFLIDPNFLLHHDGLPSKVSCYTMMSFTTVGLGSTVWNINLLGFIKQSPAFWSKFVPKLFSNNCQMCTLFLSRLENIL